jgi:putative membrane protein
VIFAAAISALHLLALAVGFTAVLSRGRAFRALDRSEDTIRRALVADTAWGVAAVLWIATGLTRLLGEHEKGLDFYLHNGWFWIKIGLITLVVLLELWPMATLMRWRRDRSVGQAPDTRNAPIFARINHVQAVLLVVIVFSAALMARGVWLFA